MEAPNVLGQTRAKAGKYLTFKLASEEYGLEILKVQEIIGMMGITKVPKMPSFIRGIINLRGRLIPVINMREKFSLAALADTDKTCIIVVQIAERDSAITIGILVDEVSEVLDILQAYIEPPPSFGANVDTNFILGIGKVGDQVKILLDIDKILTSMETHAVKSEVTGTTQNTLEAKIA